MLEGGSFKPNGGAEKASAQKKDLLTIVFAAFLAALLCISVQSAYANPLEDAGNAVASFFGFSAPETRAAYDESTAADTPTYDQWRTYLTDPTDQHFTTENVGRIWTDKTVSSENIVLSKNGTDPSFTLEKDADSDFLVMLSALSSTSNTAVSSGRPLDIVLVLDRSGSMDDELSTTTEATYNATYNIRTNGRTTYYVLNDDGENYTQVDRITGRNGRFDHWEVNGATVEPKTSASDSNASHVQFYTYEVVVTSKMDALKAAASSFIDATAAINEGTAEGSTGAITDPAKQHRIAVVSYSGDATRDLDFTAVTGTGTEGLKSTVNGLSADGGTQAGEAMDKAQDVMDGTDTWYETNMGARDNAQKVVLFFTDGEPGDYGFTDSVANAAIATAKEMKANDTLIYSIGVFDDADVDITNDRFNAYMHGVSSNYPDATAYTNLGTRATDKNNQPTQYYKAAHNADDLNSIFASIASEVQEVGAGSPTEIGSGGPTGSGYITFEDRLGDYMKVDSFTEIVYADTEFALSSKASNGNVDTYVFDHMPPDGNGYYAAENLSHIKITVQRSDDLAEGDLVTVELPAAFIPLRNFDVDTTNGVENATLEVTENYPIRIAYGVSLKAGVNDLLKNPSSDTVFQSYMAENTDNNGNVVFYSNAFEKGTDNGLTSARFEPAALNSFYNFTTDTALYTDPACTQLASADAFDPENEDYYYKRSFFKMDGTGTSGAATQETDFIKLDHFSDSVLTLKNDDGTRKYVATDANGNCYIVADSPRLQRVNVDTVTPKADITITNTANYIINPTWDTGGTAGYSEIDVWLGNNGKLTKEMPGTLTVTKDVVVPDGFDESLHKNTAFGITVSLSNTSGPLSGSYDAVVLDADGNEVTVDGIVDGKITLDAQGEFTCKLKDGQTLYIRGLSAGTEYSVDENLGTITYFDKSVTSDDDDELINAGATSAVTVTNTYKPGDAQLSDALALTVEKVLIPRPWEDGDAFEVRLIPEGNAPLPENATTDGDGNRYASVTLTKGDTTGSSSGAYREDFGNITYTTPGVYEYEIHEFAPDQELPGISYSQALYTLKVTVTDGGTGSLAIVAEMTQHTNDDGVVTGTSVDLSKGEVATFTNKFSADEVSAAFIGWKNYTDNSGTYPLSAAKDKFKFVVTALDSNDATSNYPVPAGVTPSSSFEVEVGCSNTGSIDFPLMVFKAEENNSHVGYYYTYKISEVIPEGATAGNNYTLNGMTYDPTEWGVRVDVSSDSDGKIALNWKTWDLDNSDNAVEGRTVTFNNSYDTTPVVVGDDPDEAAIGGMKTLTGRDAYDTDTFGFSIAGADDATKTAMTNGTVNFKGGTAASVSGAEGGIELTNEGFDFGNVEFKKPGTYVFDITENLPEGATAANGYKHNNITYDAHTCRVTVTVTDDNKDGTLTANVEYSGAQLFTNAYSASLDYGATTDLDVSKTMTGRAMTDGEFTFAVEGSATETATNDAKPANTADAIAMLRNITFDQDDIGQTYTYTVTEQVPAEGDADRKRGVTYDYSEYEIKVTVGLNQNDGTLTTDTTVKQTKNRAGEAIETPVEHTFGTGKQITDGLIAFTNEYKSSSIEVDIPTVPLKKLVEGRNWAENESFTFNISKLTFDGYSDAASLAKMPDIAPIKVAFDGDNEAEFHFKGVTFDHAGTYVYEVSEVPGSAEGMTYSTAKSVITIEVVDDYDTGALRVATAAVSNGVTTFVNKFSDTLGFSEAFDFQLVKTLTGREMNDGDFSFTVEAMGKYAASKIGIQDEDGDERYTLSISGAAGTLVSGTEDTYRSVLQRAEDIVFEHYINTDAEGKCLSDSGQEFIYKFSENIPTQATAENGYTYKGVTYDPTVYTMAVTPVMDLTTGTWTVTTVFTATEPDGTATSDTLVWNQGGDVQVVAADFQNSYAASGTLPLSGTKVVQGDPNPWTGNLAGFEFKIEAFDPDTKAAVEAGIIDLPDSNAISGEDGKFVFTDGVKFTKADTYMFEITEVIPAEEDRIPGITYGQNWYRLGIAVYDNGDGTLTCIEGVGTGLNTNMTFVNPYTTTESDPFTPTIRKTAEGKDAAADEFKFTLTAADDFTKDAIESGAVKADALTGDGVSEQKASPAIAKDATETISFSGITFTKVTEEDTYYTFKVTEDGASAGAPVKGWTLDNHTYTIKVKVTDVDGKLVAEQVGKGENDDLFTNTYNAEVTGDQITTEGQFTKTFTGRDWTKNDKFTFNITVPEGAPTPVKDGAECTQVTIDGSTATDGSQTFGFGTLEFTYDHIKDEPWVGGKRTKVFEYKVSEVVPDAADKLAGVTYDEHKATLKVTLTDNGDGTMTATPEFTGAMEFKNEYSSNLDFYGLNGGFDIAKHLEGREVEMDQFTFTVAPKDGVKTSAGDAAALLGVEIDGTEYKSTGGDYDVRIFGPFAQRELTQDDAGKTFVYEVSENADKDNNPSYDFDDTVYTVKITVDDNNDGSLTATTVVYDGTTEVAKQVLTTTDQGESVAPRVAVPFENTYTAKNSATAAIAAHKELTNASLADHHFTFRVTDALNNEVAVATSDDNGKIDFGTFTYTLADLNKDAASGKAVLSKEGVNYVYSYQYKVAEDAPASGITAETNFFTVTVKVIDDNHGNLRTEVVYPAATPDNPVTELVFKNVYGENAEYNLDITGTKVYNKPFGLDYNAPDIADKFEFEIAGVDEDGKAAPLPTTTKVKNDASGNVSFGSIHYDMSVFGSDPQVGQKRVKTFTYTVTETGKVEGVENDATVKTFTVTVTDEGDGTNITAVADPATGPKFTFTNEYKVTPKDSSLTGEGNFAITKKLDGRDLAAEEFEFVLCAADGSKIASAKNDASGNVEFPAMTFDKPGSYEYTLKEIALTNVDNGITYDTSSYKVVAGVVDNGKGALEVAWSVYDGIEDVTRDTPIVFPNSYEPAATNVTFGASKKLEGATVKDGQFTFQVRNEAGNVVATAKNDALGKVIFPAVELATEGTFTYTISEVNDGQEGVTYDGTQHKATVTVADDGTGHLAATVAYENGTAPVFTNTYTEPEGPSDPGGGKPGKPEPPALADTSDKLGPLTIGLAVLAVAAGAGIAVAAVKMRRKAGTHHRTK